MGIAIMIPGAHFKDEKYIIGKVKIPDPECEHEYDNACATVCNLCGAHRPVTHDYVDGYCSVCGKRDPDNPYTIDEYPVKDTLKGLYDLGGDAEASLVNHANKDLVPTVTGTVDFTDSRYATFSGALNASRIDTNVEVDINNSPITYVALFRVPTGMRTIIGNRRNNTPNAIGLDMQNGIVEYCASKTAKASGTVADDAIATDNFIILSMTASTTGYTLYRYTGGVLNSLVSDETAIDGWTYPFTSNGIKIGGCGLTSTGADADISLVAIHEGEMTEGQLEDICEFMKKYGKQKGLTVE